MRKLLALLGSLCCLAATAGPSLAAEDDAVPAPAAQALNAAGEGRRLYLKLNCYSCHGGAAAGGAGPRIVRRDLSVVSAALLNGRPGGMRSFSAYVNERDIGNIAAYLQSIGTVDEPTFNDWWIRIPPK